MRVNILRTKNNLIGYEARLGYVDEILGDEGSYKEIDNNRAILGQLRKQKQLMKQIAKWRKSTKRLVKP